MPPPCHLLLPLTAAALAAAAAFAAEALLRDAERAERRTRAAIRSAHAAS